MSGRLNSYLVDIEEQAQERFERIVEQMKQAQGITERLKADNAWEWVGRMNNMVIVETVILAVWACEILTWIIVSRIKKENIADMVRTTRDI